MQESQQNVHDVIKDKYLAVKELLGKRNEPKSIPIKSLVEAKDLLLEIASALTDIIYSHSDENNRKENIILAGVLFTSGSVSVELNEYRTAKEFMLRGLALFKKGYASPDYILTAITILFQLGVLFFAQNQTEKAYKCFGLVEASYKKYIESKSHDLIDFNDLILNTETDQGAATKALEGIYTMTLTYMASEYRKRSQNSQALVLAYNTLKKQLSLCDFDKVKWAVTAATMSEVLVEDKAFKEARYQLASADYVLGLRREELEKQLDDPMYNSWDAELRRGTADVCRCWIKYCLLLLWASKDRLMSEDETSAQNELQVPEELANLYFEGLDVKAEELTVIADWVLTWPDARLVFLKGQECANIAKGYYTLEDFASDHATIAKDHANLFQAILFWEESDSRRCKMIKKRIGILNGAVSLLNPTYYMDICREVWYEIGEAYTALMDLKMDMTSDDPQRIPKMNALMDHAVQYYDKFINSFKIPGENTLPEKFPSDFERPILFAFLHTARILSKRICKDKEETIKYTQLALSRYKTIDEYCAKQQDCLLSQSELSVCREMVSLLPAKISSLASTSAK